MRLQKRLSKRNSFLLKRKSYDFIRSSTLQDIRKLAVQLLNGHNILVECRESGGRGELVMFVRDQNANDRLAAALAAVTKGGEGAAAEEQA